jgi:hypothetical protein
MSRPTTPLPRRSAFRFAAALLLAFAALAAVPRQSAAQLPTADVQEVGRYRLTPEVVARFAMATRNMARAYETNPGSFATLRERVGERAQSLDQVAALYESSPALHGAITEAGLTSREFATIVFAMFQAALGAWLVDARGEGALAQLPPEVSRENIRFFRQNRQELERLGDEFRLIGERLAGGGPADTPR